MNAVPQQPSSSAASLDRRIRMLRTAMGPLLTATCTGGSLPLCFSAAAIHPRTLSSSPTRLSASGASASVAL